MPADKKLRAVSKVIISGDVADGAAFTVGYPEGYNAGDFSNARGHYLSLNGDKLQEPEDITLVFGANSVTVTQNTGDVLKEGLEGFFEFAIRGDRVSERGIAGERQHKIVRANKLIPVIVDFGSPKALDADGLWDGVAAGAAASAGDRSTMKAATANNGKLDVPRTLTLVGSAGADHAVTLNGFDEYGQAISETLTANGTTPVNGLKAFSEVTDYAIAAGGAAGDTLDIGWRDVFGLPFRVEAKDIVAELLAGEYYGVPKEDVYVPFDIPATQYAGGVSMFIKSPVKGDIVGLHTTISVATTGVGTLTVELEGTAVTGLSTVIAAEAVGNNDSDVIARGVATAAVDILADIEIVGDATPSAGAVVGQVQIHPNSTVVGTFVTGLAQGTKSTATTADTRGTYAPDTAADGVISFALHILSPQVRDLGNIQFAA